MKLSDQICAIVRRHFAGPWKSHGHAVELRDYLAGQALAGIVGNNMLRCQRGLLPMEECADIAERCYSLADAMVAARAREGDGK